jgi:hypothetical protein
VDPRVDVVTIAPGRTDEPGRIRYGLRGGTIVCRGDSGQEAQAAEDAGQQFLREHTISYRRGRIIGVS